MMILTEESHFDGLVDGRTRCCYESDAFTSVVRDRTAWARQQESRQEQKEAFAKAWSDSA